MNAIWGNIASAIVGAAIALAISWWTRRTATLGHWGAMLAEVEHCRDAAAVFLEDEVMAPLGRLPMDAFRRAYPILIENGRMRASQSHALTEFYSVVDQMNRGLELAQRYAAGPDRDDALLTAEYARLRKKAKHISGDKYEGVRRAILQGPKMLLAGSVQRPDA